MVVADEAPQDDEHHGVAVGNEVGTGLKMSHERSLANVRTSGERTVFASTKERAKSPDE